jgi:site-specific DNA recombinase
VWQDLCAVLTHPQRLADALERAHSGQWLPQELHARQQNLRKACTSLVQQQERLTEAYLHGVIPLAEYERRRRDLAQKEQAPSRARSAPHDPHAAPRGNGRARDRYAAVLPAHEPRSGCGHVRAEAPTRRTTH